MNYRALLGLGIGLATAMLSVGCASAAEGDDEAAAQDDEALSGTPADVAHRYAMSLGLGNPKGAARHESGVTHYRYAKGEIDLDLIAGKITSIKVAEGVAGSIPPEVAQLAVNLGLGAFSPRSNGYAGGYEYIFHNGTIGWSNASSANDHIDSVTLTGGTKLPVRLALMAMRDNFGALQNISDQGSGHLTYTFKRGVITMADGSNELAATCSTMPPVVARAAQYFQLGNYSRQTHDSPREDLFWFDQGFIVFSTVSGRMDTMVTSAITGAIDGELTEFAMNLNLGQLQAGAWNPPHQLYTFSNGAIQCGSSCALDYGVESVKVKGTQGEEKGRTITFGTSSKADYPLDILAVAARDQLGSFQRSDGAAGTDTLHFKSGYVAYTQASSPKKISDADRTSQN